MSTRSERNRQAAIDRAIKPLVGPDDAPGMDDMPKSMNGLRAALFALTCRLDSMEQLHAARFADYGPRLELAERTVASTQAQGTATATRATFLETKDSLIEAAIHAHSLDIAAVQRQVVADELATAALQARATKDEALLATAQAKADAAQADANALKTTAAAAQARLDAVATATTAAQTQADAAQLTAATAQTGLTALAARFRTKRVATTPVAVGGTMKIDVVWDVPFADDKYNAVPEFEGLALLGLVGTITNRTATGCTVSAKNILGLALLAGAGMVTVTAIHDQV
jgi:hypothetical protein